MCIFIKRKRRPRRKIFYGELVTSDYANDFQVNFVADDPNYFQKRNALLKQGKQVVLALRKKETNKTKKKDKSNE